jgi:periplasmic protein TonB
MTKRQFVLCLACLGVAVLAGGQTEPAKQPPEHKISSGVAQGLKTHNVDPIYPVVARNAGIYGDVILHATIDTNGKIGSIRPVQGEPILVKASIDAVKQWRYRPFIFNGKPVQVETTIKIQFRR